MNPLTQRLLMSAAGKAAIPGAWNLGSIGNDPLTGSTSDITAAGIFDGRLVFGTAAGVVFTQQINRSWVPRFGSELLGPVRKIDSFSGGNWAAGKGYFIREYAGESLSGALYGGTGEWGTTSSNASAVLSMRFATKPVAGNDLNIVVFGGEKGALAFTTDRGTTITRGIAPGTSGLGTLGDVVEIIFKETPVYTGDSRGWWAFYRGGSYVYTAGIDGGYNPNNWSGSTARDDLKNLLQSGETVLNVKLILNQFVVLTNFGRIFLSYTGLGNWEVLKDIKPTANSHTFQDAIFDGQNYLALASSQIDSVRVQVFSNKLDNDGDRNDFVDFTLETAGQQPLGNVIFYHNGRYYIGLPGGQYLYKTVTVTPVTKLAIQPMVFTLPPNTNLDFYVDYYHYLINKNETLQDVVLINDNGAAPVRESKNNTAAVQMAEFPAYVGSVYYEPKPYYKKLSINSGAAGKVRVFGRKYRFRTTRDFNNTPGYNITTSSRSYITAINQWGNATFLSLEGAFANNQELTTLPSESMPSLIYCHSMTAMFANCIKLNAFPKLPATLQSVRYMAGMFYNCSEFNQPIVNETGGSLNTVQLVELSNFLYGAVKWNNKIDINIHDFSTGFRSSADIYLTNMFAQCRALTGQFDSSISNLKFSSGQGYSYICNGMFRGCHTLNTSLATSGSAWNTSAIRQMADMFSECYAFNGSLAGWDVSGNTTFSFTFYGAVAFNQDISSWNTSNVQYMSGMFGSAQNFNKNISYNPTTGAWNTANVITMASMFYGATKFNNGETTNNKSAPLNWNTGKVTTMESMFRDARAFNQNLNSWNTSKVTNMSSMFRDAKVFNGNISNWDTLSVTSMASMFYGAEVFNQPIFNNINGTNIWLTNNVTDMSSMFREARLFNQNVGGWNVSKVADMSYMFFNAWSFDNNQSDSINNWKTDSATDMRFMFYGCAPFKRLTYPISGAWNTSQVRNMSYMFYGCVSFNGALTDWNVSRVTDMSYMFFGAREFRGDLRGWNVSNVTDMRSMFHGARVFNSPIGNWGSKTSKVTNMSYMFSGALNFNQDLNAWDTSNVTNMYSMFYNGFLVDGDPSTISAFNGEISNWNTSKVISMSYMFFGTPFNKPIDYNSQTGAWNTISVTNMDGMFSSSRFNQPISNWNVSNVTNMEYMFRNNTQFNQLISTWNTSKLIRVRGMFSNATAFNNGGFLFNRHVRNNGTVTGWDTSKIVDSGYDSMWSMFEGSGFEAKLFYYTLDEFPGETTPRFQRTNSWCVSLISTLPQNFGMIYRGPVWGTCPTPTAAAPLSGTNIYSQGQKIIANEGYRKYGYFGAGIASSYDGSTIAIGGNYGNAIDYLTAHSGSVHIYVKNGNTWQFQAELVSPVDVAYNEFGVRDRAIGLSSDGNVLAVGEPERGGGHVHVYSRVGTSWFYRASLPNPSSLSGEGGTTDKYGASLSISSFGDVILIGADGDVAGTGTVRGTAYVWRNYGFKDSPNWQLEATLVPSGGNYQRQFGWSTALSKDGTVAVIGAIAEPDIEAINVLNMGAAYIFRRNSNGTWIQESRLLPSLRQSQALFGVSVAMTGDGSTIVVGALGGKIGQRIGRVYIYRRTVSGSFYSTTLTQFLDSDQPGPSYQSDDYGDSVSLSEDGQILVVGAPEQDTQRGKVYVYVRNLNGTYVQRQTLVNSDTTLVDRIGGALVVSPGSGLVLTSAPRHTPTYPDLLRAGAVYVWNTI